MRGREQQFTVFNNVSSSEVSNNLSGSTDSCVGIDFDELENPCLNLQWVVVDESFNGFLELPDSSVCLRGTPYWLGYLNGVPYGTIQSFDFYKQRFKSLFLTPSCVVSEKLENSLSLGVFRGDRLSLLHKSRVTSKIHLWVMKKHWSRLMTVGLPEFPMCPKYSSYFIENHGKIVLSIHHLGSISIYIVGEDQECQKVKYSSMDRSVGGSGCYYVPSLLPVPGFL
ncbi:F-box associated domain type 1 [Arabidopsis thaliana x Arabidopsis arenosa]|uniref:F-box associated beta-propeller type 1 domain-containing protein n=2 Tax=Arabidopsis TaxID=3701 RepID=A0A178W8X9_ARATH|nr:F-box associated domain type 1 [Arabidopsis thaliana x Arabidopsis arenosa]OAP14788.1 hypothetical protein AXX17_AT1G11940 [Arabidopsis thaliana]